MRPWHNALAVGEGGVSRGAARDLRGKIGGRSFTSTPSSSITSPLLLMEANKAVAIAMVEGRECQAYQGALRADPPAAQRSHIVRRMQQLDSSERQRRAIAAGSHEDPTCTGAKNKHEPGMVPGSCWLARVIR